ncbi:serine/threonine-protein phosphatase [Actinocorallia sp. API 0066]|uniref:PP2C family protein-serine/threonine phosphatase n=1 Tax=Actinocorallia sp. API 0066 TaxID=2896846 RepID=UPI001E5BF33C|nr:PP2C family protein-serine/threonine phosphatase [Actinocorallia sp. API 0066]MCD0449856.1 serine/threonine-protein phosphatase [Actinocorallia sp. API 0066]
MHARCLPAEGAPAGGDFYDVAETPFGVRAVIGDVTGHGRPVAGLAGEVRDAFGALAAHEPLLEGVALRLDGFVARRCGTACECFVSAALVQWGAAGGQALVCGHPAPLLLAGDGVREVPVLDGALPLGLGQLEPGVHRPVAFALAAGESLLLYTDGAIEARDASGVIYPFVSRVAELVSEQPSSLLAVLEAELLAHAGGTAKDDIAFLHLQAEPSPVPTSVPAMRGRAR